MQLESLCCPFPVEHCLEDLDISIAHLTVYVFKDAESDRAAQRQNQEVEQSQHLLRYLSASPLKDA